MMTQKEIKWGWAWLAVQMLLLPSVVTQLAAPLGSAAVNFLYHFVSFLAVILIFHSFLKKAACTFQKRFKRVLPVLMAALAAYYLAGWLLDTAIGAIDPGFSNVNDNAIAGLRRGNLLLTAIATVALAPVSEECLFRGLIFCTAGKHGRLAAYGLSAAAFAAIHVAGYVGAFPLLRLGLCFVQYLPAGVLLAWAMERTDSICTAICMHLVINAVSLIGIL